MKNISKENNGYGAQHNDEEDTADSVGICLAWTL
jgi:hypothetical protein